MKKLILILILTLTLPVLSEARMNLGMVGGGVVVSTTSCDTCTGGLLFSAYWENDTDITTGTPCGCAAASFGDTTGTITGDATVTGGYINIPNAADYITYGVTTFPETGSMLVKTESKYYQSGTRIVSFIYDEINSFELWYEATDDIVAAWRATSPIIGTGDNPVAIDNIRWVVLRWRTGTTNPSMTLKVYNTSEVEQGSGVTTDEDFSAMLSKPVTMNVGNNSANTGALKVYSLKIWDTFNGAPSSGF